MARDVFNRAKELLMQRRTMSKQVSVERPLKDAMNREGCAPCRGCPAQADADVLADQQFLPPRA